MRNISCVSNQGIVRMDTRAQNGTMNTSNRIITVPKFQWPDNNDYMTDYRCHMQTFIVATSLVFELVEMTHQNELFQYGLR